MMSSMPSEQQIAEAIERVLSRREFGGGEQPWPWSLLDRIADWLSRAFTASMETLGGFGTFVLILLAVGILCLVGWLIYSERRYRLGHREKRSSYEQPVSGYTLAHAEALALQQDWTGALLALYAYHLHELHQQGWIVLDESKTGLQYQWELRMHGYADIEGFEAFRKVFNRVRYGGYAELRETYETFLAYCRKELRRRQAA